MEGLAPTLGPLASAEQRRSLTSPLFHVPVCQMQRPPALQREREREIPYDSAKQKCGRSRVGEKDADSDRESEGRAAGKPIKNYMPSNRQLQRILLRIP